jgi:hypothetical protein
MKMLKMAGAVLRWLLNTAVTLLIVLLFLRALVEYLPALEALPFVRAVVGWWDPQLAAMAQAVGVPWSHDVRGIVLPGVAVGLIILRLVVQDAFARATGRWRPAATPPPPAAPPPASGAVDFSASTMLKAPPPAEQLRSPTGTGFFPSQRAAPPAAALHIGRYEILGELGHGAMGVVYKALDPKIGRTVAIKTISAVGSGPDLEQYRGRFLIEAKSAGRLNHPGVVAVHDVTEDELGRPCLVLEFVDGTPLDKLAAEAALPLPQVLDIVAQVARALAYAHAHGIVHRDIKPANVMLTASGQAKLSDFGIAKLEGTSMTIAGQVMGTPAYMSPEQCTGSAVDQRSDIFSLGSVLYTLVTGAKPFAGDTFTTVAYRVAHTSQAPARELNPVLPPELDGIIAKCLAKNPADRYATASDLAADLESLRAALVRDLAAPSAVA